MVDHEVLKAWGWESAAVEPWGSGLVNTTFRVKADDAFYILQRVHPVFRPEVHLDIDAVTHHLSTKGIATPRIVRAADGALWIERQGDVWRALTFLEGAVHDRVSSPEMARQAGGFVAQFHAALLDLEHTFRFSRPGAHDTAAHLAALAEVLHTHPHVQASVRDLGRRILVAGHHLPAMAGLPLHVVHGDLKLNNLLFDGARPSALLDLDTLGRQTMAVELGDALRSWCNLSGEDAPDAVAVDRDVFRAALEGYAGGAPRLLSEVEIESIVTGLETISLELSARFCRDAIEDKYFGWDPTRYASRCEHNLARAQCQLRLSQSVTAGRAALHAIVRAAFRKPSPG